jgi:hypothetical protein
MNQNERDTNGPSCQSDPAGSAILPTENSPSGDPATQPKRGADIKPGQPNVAGIDPAAGDSEQDESAIEAPAGKPRNDDNTL